MKLYYELPYDNPECHDQTQLIDNTKEEFMALFKPATPNILQRFYRLLCFFLFLGPIKILVVLFSFAAFYVVCIFVPYFRGRFRNNREYKKWAQSICKPFVRLALLGLGIVNINYSGVLHEDSRTIIANHLCLVETLIILYHFPVAYLAASNLASHIFIKRVRQVFEIVFVDRSNKNNHITQQLVNIANDPSLLPVLVFPEGKITNGDALVGFRSGAFVAETPVQAIAIRYRQYLMPKEIAQISWNEDNWYFYCYQCFAIPFMTVDATVLEPLNWKGSEKSPQEKAVDAELQIANALHTKPFSMTNKVLFDKPKAD